MLGAVWLINLNGSIAKMVHLNIATLLSVPMVFECGLNTLRPSKNCMQPGISHEFLAFVLETMNATYRLIPIRNKTVTNGFYFSGDNDTHPVPVGVLRDLQAGKYDVIGCEYEFSSLRANYFDYSYQVQQSPLVFLMKKSEFSFFTRMVLVFKVFHWKVYLLIIGTFTAMVIGLIAAKNISKGKAKLLDTSDAEVFINATLSGMEEQEFCSGKTLAVLFGLLTMLVTGLYQGCLLTQLLMPPQARPFRNFDELIERVLSKELTLITDDEAHSFFEAIRSSPISDYQRLNAAVKRNPIKVVPDADSLLEHLQEDAYVLPCGTQRAKFLLQTECHLQQVSAEGFENSWIGFIFTKNSPYLSQFNQALITAQAYAHFVEDKYGKTSEKCLKEANRVGIDPLSLLSFTGLFMLLLAGAIIASLCFFYEYISRRRRREYIVQFRY